MLNQEHILNQLKNHQSEFKGFGVERIGLFGSYIRNEQNDNSDIDLLVEFSKDEKTIKNYFNVCEFIDTLFPIRVEVLTEKSISKYILPQILKEVKYVKI